MRGTHSTFLVEVVVTTLAALVSTGAVADTPFSLACQNPSFPGGPAAIDESCGAKGAGAREAAQNQVKNSFCATGSPTTLTFAQLAQWQKDVEQNKDINFGNSGPTQNRAPLKQLGEGKLVQLTAFVLVARAEGGESVNCGHKFDQVTNKDSFHDIHISLVATMELANPTNRVQSAANECQGIVAEMIPHHRPVAWTADNVKRVAAAHLPVRVTGQLFFDSSHVPCAQGKPVASNPKRISLWEIHPIYAFEVCTANCDAEPTWVPLEKWATAT